MAVITFNPLYAVFSEEYSDASYVQRIMIIQSKCREGESVILTLSNIYPGDILQLEIEEINIVTNCILRTYSELSTEEINHILSISPYLKIE